MQDNVLYNIFCRIQIVYLLFESQFGSVIFIIFTVHLRLRVICANSECIKILNIGIIFPHIVSYYETTRDNDNRPVTENPLLDCRRMQSEMRVSRKTKLVIIHLFKNIVYTIILCTVCRFILYSTLQ